MNASDQLRQAIDDEERRLRAGIPPERQAALLALLRLLDSPPGDQAVKEASLATGRRLLDLGGKRALCLCVEPKIDVRLGVGAQGELTLDEWARSFLRGCALVVEARTVLAFGETGSMHLIADEAGSIHAWFASKLPPPAMRERYDIDWWADALARTDDPRTGTSANLGAPASEEWARQVAAVRVAAMRYQFDYPPEAVLGGVTVQTYRDLLAWLIARALMRRLRGESPVGEARAALAAAISTELRHDPQTIGRALDGFTLNVDNAAYHAAITGGGSVPIVALDAEHVALSLHGLTTEPWFFLTRELRRRDAQVYHNAAFMREARFRENLFALFQDTRFVTSRGRIQVRREQGELRTDIDAAIFDRKTGALAIFELKSHDPFARSATELARQRDNVLYANRQISGVLDWLKRHGADDLLSRIDQPTAKRYRVSKVLPFVLGRYLVRFNDGPAPDRRAAWATWPQLLRAIEERPPIATASSPLATLFARLSRDDPFATLPAQAEPEVVSLGDRRLFVYPSYAAFRARTS